jgi:hypothetical protein
MSWMAGVRFPVEARIFFSPQRPAASGAQPASYPMGTGAISQAGKEAEA